MLGNGVSAPAEEARGYGASRVYVIDDAYLTHCIAERIVPSIVRAAKQANADIIVAAATAFGKDVLPCLAESMDAAFVGDCIGFDSSSGEFLWHRPIMAGNAVAYCKSDSVRTVISVRHTEFEPAARTDTLGPIEYVNACKADSSIDRVKLLEYSITENTRPDIAEARVVVSGGRPLGERFFKVLGPLADALGAALGATRSACDGGYAPADYQVGQTGKVVSPDLYIAVGISGAIQHISGIKGSRVIVAINSDPDAPIISMADYALVGNLFELVPQLVGELQRRERDA